MDDTKPANETNEPGLNKIDLSQLQDFTFGTQWTEVKNAPGGARRDDRRERRDDGGRGAPPRDRRAFRKPAVPATGAGGGGPGPGGGAGGPGGGGGGDPAMRERPQGEGFRGGPRRDFRGGGDRGERRDFRGGDRRDGPPMERGPYISPYFTMTCYPEDAGFAAMVKAVRASCRTFQLFEITKAVLEKNERFVLVIQRKTERAAPAEAREGESPAAPARAEKPAPMFMSVPDHLPFETEEAALHHVLTNHLGTFFSTQDVEIEPPKGNFPIINRCGVTGELLGPPNYHKYQQILQQHHATRLGRMSFERFRDSIQSVREPEVVQQWLDKMKKATRYTWVYGQKPAAAKAAPAESGAETPTAEAPAAAEPAAAATPEAPAAVPAADAPAAATAPAEPVPVTPAPEAAPAPASAPTPVAAGPSFDSLEEAKAYLLATAKEKAVRAVENVRFHGRLIEKLPPGEIRRAVEGHVERQRRFPLDTANALRGRLRREGFTIFKKGSRGVSYVCAVKRRFRVPGQVFSETITALIDFIEKNPLVHVKDLPKQLLGLDLGAPAAPAEGSAAPTPAPAPALPPEQADKIRKMSNDLRWLVTEGYVTEFSDGKLFAPPPVSPQAQKRPDEHGEEHDPVDFPEAPAAAKPAEAAAAEAGATQAEAAESPEPSDAAPVESGEAPLEPAEPAPVPESAAPSEEAPPKPEANA